MISVIIPVYKVEKYLPRCVESVLSQRFSDFELILVDDGSPDSCGEICDEYALKDSRIVVIHKQNGGLSDARNAGLDIAKGQYVCFIDSDDYVKTDYLQILYDSLISSDADFSMCGFSCFDENERELPDNGGFKCLQENLVVDEQQFWQLTYSGFSTVVAWNKLYKWALFEYVRYPVGKINEDEFVLHHIVQQCKKISICKESLYMYLRRSNSITGRQKYEPDFDAVQALLERQQYFVEKNYWKLSEKNVSQLFALLESRKNAPREKLQEYKKTVLQDSSKGLNHWTMKGRINYCLMKLGLNWYCGFHKLIRCFTKRVFGGK